jgi:hypothetical protein
MVASMILAFGRILSIWWIPVATLSTILAVTVIAALQLRHDDRLTQANFLKLMRLAFSQIPLLGKLVPRTKSNE